MTDQTPDTIRALAERLERRADIEDVGDVRCPHTEETDAAYESAPEVTWEEMREIVGLLRESAATLRALADQSQRADGGRWPARSLQRAFVAGAEWWEFVESGGTMWASDRAKVEDEAVRRYGDPDAAAPAPTGVPEVVHRTRPSEVAATHYGDPAWLADYYQGLADEFRRQAARTPDPATPAPTGAPTTEERDTQRCAVCGWPLDPAGKMCARGNCSMRPLPDRLYDAARAVYEYGQFAPPEWRQQISTPGGPDHAR